METAFGLFEIIGGLHIFGRDWGDLDKLDRLDWELVASSFINTFSKHNLWFNFCDEGC